MMIKGATKIKTILVMIILLLVGVLGVVGMGAVRTYMSGAAASEGPKNVQASVSADGKTATVTFTTEKKTSATIMYGTSPGSMLMSKSSDEETTDFSISISPLKTETLYYYSININNTTYDNAGIPYSISTTVKESEIPTSTPVPTVTVSSSECNNETDYNQDGTINSLDLLDCKSGKSATPTKANDCEGKDFNNDGVVNAVDLIQCGQKSNP